MVYYVSEMYGDILSYHSTLEAAEAHLHTLITVGDEDGHVSPADYLIVCSEPIHS